MSARYEQAFVKEQDTGVVDDLPDRPTSAHPNDVTEQDLILIAAATRARRDLRCWTWRHPSARIVPPPASTSEVRFGSA